MITYCGHKIPINVLIVPSVAVPFKSTYSRDFAISERFETCIPCDRRSSVQVLIGADHYCSFVQNRVVRGNGPKAMRSKLGYPLSGPLPLSSADDTTVNYMLITYILSNNSFTKVFAFVSNPDHIFFGCQFENQEVKWRLHVTSLIYSPKKKQIGIFRNNVSRAFLAYYCFTF